MPRVLRFTRRNLGAKTENGGAASAKRIAKYQHQSRIITPTPVDGVAKPPVCGGVATSVLPRANASDHLASSALTPAHTSLLSTASAAVVFNMHTADRNAMTTSRQQYRRGSGTGGSARNTAPDRRLSLDEMSSASSIESSTAVSTPNLVTVGTSLPVPSPFDDVLFRIDVNAAKNSKVHHDTGPLDLTLTVLRSCPLYDTIAILIILMQLSPIALSSIYMMFTILTFVPPGTTGSTLSISDIFEGTLGTPALSTLIFMDIGALLIWLFLWGPIQLLILDLAQVVIALTLGGGTGSRGSFRNGSANNIFVCFGIVVFSHFGSVPNLQKLSHLNPFSTADQSFSPGNHQLPFQPATKLFARRAGNTSWVRNIFAIHILMQGVVRYVREWYLRRENRDATVHNNPGDTETSKGYTWPSLSADAGSGVQHSGSVGSIASSNSAMRATMSSTASNTSSIATSSGNNNEGIGLQGVTGGTSLPVNHVSNGSLAGSAGGNASAATSAASGSYSTASSPNAIIGHANNNTGAASSVGSNVIMAMGQPSAKRKRKQSTMVRVRQPLWAALASTKIVMIKEYELSQAASESAGAEATDADNLGNAPFYAQLGQIWICYVGHDEVCFNTSKFPDGEECRQNDHLVNMAYIDTTKPFYVKINNATWQPTRIAPVVDETDDETAGITDETVDNKQSLGTKWTGDIYGLTPLSSYECEFVSTRTGDVLFSTSVRTAPAPSRSTDIATIKPAAPSQLRPHESPASTIKASIAAQESKLNDGKLRLKTLRKDNHRKVNALRKEIDRLASSVQSAGGNDEKLRQKITQNTVQQKQAEQAIGDIEAELKEFNVLPNDLLSRHRGKKGEWDREKAQFDGAVASFKSFKSAVDSEIRSLEEEEASLQAKRNKIASRIAKADNDHDRIMDANSRGLDEAERRRQERASIDSDILRVSKDYDDKINVIRSSNEDKVNAINAMHETMRSFYSSFDSERPYEDRYVTGPFSFAAASAGTSAANQISWPTQQLPHAAFYAQRPMWPTLPTSATAPGPSPALPSTSSTSPFLHMAPLYANALPHHPRMRGRSSSMLSDVSGFTQSSAADEDVIVAPSTSTLGASTIGMAVESSEQSTIIPASRGPPGFGLGRTRGSYGSGCGSGSVSASSTHSGSGSAGSSRDPASP